MSSNCRKAFERIAMDYGLTVDKTGKPNSRYLNMITQAMWTGWVESKKYMEAEKLKEKLGHFDKYME